MVGRFPIGVNDQSFILYWSCRMDWIGLVLVGFIGYCIGKIVEGLYNEWRTYVH